VVFADFVSISRVKQQHIPNCGYKKPALGGFFNR